MRDPEPADQLSGDEHGRSGRAPACRRSPARRLGWGVADQAVSSLTNFALGAVVAHMLSVTELGAFSLAYVTYGVALNCSRGLGTDPMMVRLAGSDHAQWRRAARQTAGLALVIGLLTGLVVIVASLSQPPPLRGAMLALGLVLPALLLQDSWRYAFFVTGRGRQAVVNDLVWAAALVPALWGVSRTEERSAFWFLLAWGCAAAVAAVVGMAQARLRPAVWDARTWLSQHRDLGVRFMAEGMTGAMATQFRAYGVGVVLGLSAVGYLQVLNTLMGPFMVVFFGIGAVAVPVLGTILRDSTDRFRRAAALLSVALASLALVWGTVLWLVLPHGVGEFLVGDIWRPAHDLVPLATLVLVGTGVVAGASGALHAIGAARHSLRAMAWTSLLVVVCSVVGAHVAGLRGCLIGNAAASAAGAVLWWRELRIAARDLAARADRTPPGTPPPGATVSLEDPSKDAYSPFDDPTVTGPQI